MFNLVKWAFKLGQQTERQRITGVLSENRRMIPYYEYGTGNDTDKRTEVQKLVDKKVDDIIGSILDPRQQPEYQSYSVLYPKEDK